MRKFLVLAVFPLLSIAACDGTENNNVVAGTQVMTVDVASNYQGLTSDYLAGDWCYTHYQVMDPGTKTLSREEINKNFIFATDGTYITQQDSGAPMTTNGTYEFLPQGEFKFIIGKAKVVSVNPDEFVLNKTVDHYFVRGICK